MARNTGIIVHNAEKATHPDLWTPRPKDNSGRPIVKEIILHHTGSFSELGDQQWLSYSSLLHSRKTFKDDRGAVSTNKLFLRRNNRIIKIVGDGGIAYHAGYSRHKGREGLNVTSLGYEICNSGQGEPYTPEQYYTVAHSVAYDLALYERPDSDLTDHKTVRTAWKKAHPILARTYRVDDKYDPYQFDYSRLAELMHKIRRNWPYDIELYYVEEPFSVNIYRS